MMEADVASLRHQAKSRGRDRVQRKQLTDRADLEQQKIDAWRHNYARRCPSEPPDAR